MNRSPLIRSLARVVATGAVCLLVAAACGDDSTDEPAADGAAATEPSADGDTTAETPTDAPPDSEATEPAPEEPTEVATFEGELVGLFSVDAAVCDGADVSGSYFAMIQPGGSLADGPFVPNADSTCTDTTLTPLAPGTDGGLLTGTYQPAPEPAFDDAGNGLSNPIVEPATFFAVAFSIATEETGNLPTITTTNGGLTGDLSAWTAYYADLTFQQGAPEPDGSLPGLTSEVTGTIDAATGAYTLDWSSQIVGGAFNDFTGVWHLEGTFQPAG